jgi:hypothetical protein
MNPPRFKGGQCLLTININSQTPKLWKVSSEKHVGGTAGGIHSRTVGYPFYVIIFPPYVLKKKQQHG